MRQHYWVYFYLRLVDGEWQVHHKCMFSTVGGGTPFVHGVTYPVDTRQMLYGPFTSLVWARCFIVAVTEFNANDNLVFNSVAVNAKLDEYVNLK